MSLFSERYMLLFWQVVYENDLAYIFACRKESLGNRESNLRHQQSRNQAC